MTKLHIRHLGLTITLVFIIFCFHSCHRKKTFTDMIDKDIVVVATSSWTAAYAYAAGAEKVIVLAPYDMPHPSEYELRPGDIPKLMDATMIVFAGYEAMTGRLKKGLNLSDEKLLQIETDYNFVSMEKSIMKIAARLGSETIARENLAEITCLLDDARSFFYDKNMNGLPVITHRFQSSFVRELGLVPVLIFGPSSPEVSDIISVSRTDASIIIDNFHNPVGKPFKEVLPDVRYKQLLNFPGQKNTKTLFDVIRYNVSQILQE